MMLLKRTCIAITILLFCLISTSLSAVNSKAGVLPESFLTTHHIYDHQGMTTEQYISLSTKDVQRISGRKLSLREKIALKLTQRVIRKKLKKGEEFSFEDAANYNFSLGGFLLGFFLGLLGVLIALIAFPKDVFKSSLVGLLCFIIVLLLGLLVI